MPSGPPRDLEKDLKLLTFIRDHIERHGFAPSVMEMCEHMGVSSTATIAGRLRHLEAEGAIRRVGPRAIALGP